MTRVPLRLVPIDRRSPKPTISKRGVLTWFCRVPGFAPWGAGGSPADAYRNWRRAA